MADDNQANMNLATAKTTVKYVQERMEFGASNKFPNLAAAMCVGWGGMDGRMRQDVDKDLASAGFKRGSEASPGAWKKRIEVESYNAKSWRCGNCGEQASIAFTYLRELGIRPLDYYEAEGTFTRHAFVIIGLDAGTDKTDYTKWNKSAIMCDPWRGVADFVTGQSSYFSGKALTHHYRED
jgi:hypothetical protein